MTLQIVNMGMHTIKVFPFMPICQIKFISLTSVPKNNYNSMALSSMYIDDDGGPSFWWKDKRIKELHQKLGKSKGTINIEDKILNALTSQEPEVIERFEQFIDKTPDSRIDSADMALYLFSESEEKKKNFANIKKYVLAIPFTASLSIMLKLIVDHSTGILLYGVIFITVIFFLVGIYNAKIQIGE